MKDAVVKKAVKVELLLIEDMSDLLGDADVDNKVLTEEIEAVLSNVFLGNAHHINVKVEDLH